jgi:acyl-CoA thioester hydrolase
MSRDFRHRVRVRYAECDPQGVVYFARYPEYLDVALTELWRERIGPYGEMVEAGSDMVVAELGVRYRGSAAFDDELDVTVGVERLGETSLTLAWAIERDGETLVEGSVRQVCIDPQTKAKKPLPPDVRDALS